LDALLAGSRYDFILLGSLEDPDNVQRVVLSPHSSSAGGSTAPGQQQAYRPPAQSAQTDDDDNDAFVSPQPAPPTETVQPAPVQQPGSPQVRTPEQLLQELQRMRQQQQQQQPQQQSPQQQPR
jgi:hypothetical protein